MIIRTPGTNTDAATNMGDWPEALFTDAIYEGMTGLRLFGTDMPLQLPASQAFRERGDFSGADGYRDNWLARIGSPTVAANYVTVSGTNYYADPKSPSDIAALIDPDTGLIYGGITLFGVARFPNVASFLAGTNAGVTTFVSGIYLADNGAYQSIATLDDGLGGHSTCSIASDAYTGTGFEFLAATFTTAQMKLYRMRPGLGAFATDTEAASLLLGGDDTMLIGRSVGAQQTAAVDIAINGHYGRALSDTEVQTGLYIGLQTFLAGLDTPLAI